MSMKEPRISQLRELVERASRDNPHLTSRLERAAFLALLRPIERVGKDHFRVGAEDGLRHYDVINGHCQCSDYLRHGAGHPCKHRLALSLLRGLGCRKLRLGGNSGDPPYVDSRRRSSAESTEIPWASGDDVANE